MSGNVTYVNFRAERYEKERLSRDLGWMFWIGTALILSTNGFIVYLLLMAS